MRYKIVDKRYRFVSAFDTETGAYVRTGVLDDEGRDTGVDPFMASFPHLIDVGVMGHCLHGRSGLCQLAGIGCYQSGPVVEQPNMALDDFRWICGQCRGRTNQLALGGRGDPDCHEEFEALLRTCRENDLVPNFTTSGFAFTPEKAEFCRRYCGAVAVSWYRSDYTRAAIRMLLDAGVKTNVHYVLGNGSIDEAIGRLERDDFPEGLNAVTRRALLRAGGRGAPLQGGHGQLHGARSDPPLQERPARELGHLRGWALQLLHRAGHGDGALQLRPGAALRGAAAGRGRDHHRGRVEQRAFRGVPRPHARRMPGLRDAGALHGRLPTHAPGGALRQRGQDDWSSE